MQPRRMIRCIYLIQQKEEFEKIWCHYFDLDRDYGEIKSFLLKEDEKLREAVEKMWGVRILNQEFFETLISFIILQNKQIPHIKQIRCKNSARLRQISGKCWRD